MRSVAIRTAFVLMCSIACCVEANAQQYKAAPLPVQKSTFIADVKALKAATPGIGPTELAEAANAIVDKKGLAFAIAFDTASCEKIRSAKAAQKDPNAPLAIGATLKSVDLEGASLALPEPMFASGDCGCYIELPLLQITDRDFITVISGKNIRFHLPANFFTHDVSLLDEKDTTKAKRKWRVPFRGTPIGVSHDENVVYLAFEEPELADLSLMIFGEGVFQIGTRAEADEGGKGKAVENVGAERRIKFERWGKTYVIGYRDPCR